MKKIYITIALLFGISTLVSAQEVTYGVKAGVTVSDWRGDASEGITDLVDLTGVVSTRPNVGFHVGGFAVIPLQAGFTLEPGVIYNQKGMHLSETLVDMIVPITAKAVVKSHYIDLPVMAKFQAPGGFQIFGGPQVSYLVANRLKTKAGILGLNVQENFKIDAGFRKVDVALAGGIGYQFANGTNISASYEHGLSSIDENGFFDAYNRAFKATVGIALP
jgi:hypothetical protein